MTLRLGSPFIRLLTGLCLLLAAAGCSGDRTFVSNGAGRLTLSLTVDNTFYYPDGTIVSPTGAYVPQPGEISVSMKSMTGNYGYVWSSFSDFPQGELYFMGTYYLQAFYGYGHEGFNHPYYSAEMEVNLLSDRQTDTEMILHPVSTANTVSFSPEFSAYFSKIKAYLHASGGGYYDYPVGEGDILYLLPGETSLYLELTLSDGRVAGYRAARLDDAASGIFYDYILSVDTSGETPVVNCTVGSETFTESLTDGFLAAKPPVIRPIGWENGGSIPLPEGEQPAAPVKAAVSSSSPLSSLILTVNSPYLNSLGVPAQCDLLHLSDEHAGLLRSLGLSWSAEGTDAAVDFTTLLGNIVFVNEAQAVNTLCLLAEDSQGRCGYPVSFSVTSTPVEIEVVDVPAAMTGASEAEVTVSAVATDFGSHVDIELLSSAGEWIPTTIIECKETSPDRHRIRFAIPDGSGDINARILYCKEVRADVVIERFMPSFDLQLDPYATYCCVKVTDAEPDIIRAVTSSLSVYLNGTHASVLTREPETGIIIITGLTPKTTYELTGTMMIRPDKDDFTTPLKFVTESTPALPNADFEERRDGIKYEEMPSGGRYSQTTVAIFNWQNHTTFALQEPKEWANTNAKTFNRHAGNHNTWYMQPSVYTVRDDSFDGSFAVCLRSVAFDMNGEMIADYTQTGQPYLNYSPIVPRISSRAAGKLFLGSYSFDPATMTETYNDVVDWKSRPMSLNGYYKYSPSTDDPSDMGIALIEVYGIVDGKPEVIGSGRAYLPVSNSYAAFRAPVNYDRFGVKATGLKVMFASSRTIGTIAEETASIVTTPYPKDGASIGSTLWLDHVNLSY
ncbi:MAG: DUF4493 domain-containing protein [Staphylococcus sp.]|nr:DUF4493 domain-containing protein [Staphylococcus sp.]